VLDQPIASGEDYDSPFEEDVATVVRGLGFVVDAQVGSVGFKIDLAVRDPNAPGRYLAAIECDGATYHHALWARERDRLRQDVLENLGWRFHRIWSTDWFYRRDAEIKRLADYLNGAAVTAAKPPPSQSTDIIVENEEVNWVGRPGSQIYAIAEFHIDKRKDPHEVSAAVMSGVVEKVIETEGPIHVDELTRRVANLWGKDRAGARLGQAVLNGLDHLRRSNRAIRKEEDFCFTADQQHDCPIRDRSDATTSLQRVEMLPPLEIQACARRVLEENGAIGREEIAIAVTRMLGFRRTGPELRSKIEREIGGLLQAGIIFEEQGRLFHRELALDNNRL
jgi:hypothetical protein